MGCRPAKRIRLKRIRFIDRGLSAWVPFRKGIKQAGVFGRRPVENQPGIPRRVESLIHLSGGHGDRTRNRFPGTSFPMKLLAIRLPS